MGIYERVLTVLRCHLRPVLHPCNSPCCPSPDWDSPYPNHFSNSGDTVPPPPAPALSKLQKNPKSIQSLRLL